MTSDNKANVTCEFHNMDVLTSSNLSIANRLLNKFYYRLHR